jgi:hypothetical protein
VLPPDTVGAIGPDHYVQMVNLSFAIWDRAGNLLHGPASNNTLWQGFGGPCEKTNDGDPIVLYDHLADRWMMSQFALPRFPRGPFYQCIAVSQGPDPTGAWYLYEFKMSQSKLNDYPKFGLWPDGYYMAFNQFQCSIFGCSWGGQGVVAFERSEMLNGGNARMVYFDLESVDPNLGGMLPADLDGPEPPMGAPNPFVQIDDNAWGYSPDQLQIWNFLVDWANPNASTFTFDRALDTESFDSNLCNYSRSCIPQPGGAKVDAISDRLMYRLQYRNFGDDLNPDQTLVVNHTVDVDGSDHAGVRWYELNDDGSGWTMAQQGTYAPDDDHRWMGSAAMNGAGDIALGYSVSSVDTYPSIRFTGRLDTDIAPVGEMTIAEGTIFAGGGSQTHSSGRWGDYSMLTVDPVDDCTFWYTQEYYAANPDFSADWKTRIGSFKLAECALVNDPNNPPTANDDFPITNEDTAVTIDVLSNDSDLDSDTLSVASVTQGSNGLVTNNGANVTYTPNPDYYGLDSFTYTASDGNGGTSPPATVTVTVTPVNDAPVAGDDTYGVNENDTLSVAAPGGVLADDNDVEGDNLSAVWVSGPSNGELTLNPNGSFDYTPDNDFIGGDSFVYTADDGTEISNEATVTITVTPVGGGTTMHVGDLDESSAFSGRRQNKWIATVTVRVDNEAEEPVTDATVSGDWSNGAKGSGSCTTDAFGMCDVSKGGLKLTATTATFTVTGVTHASLAYDGDVNHDEVDADSSDGTVITVNKP